VTTPAVPLPVARRSSLARRLFRSVVVMLSLSVLAAFVAVELIADESEVTLLRGEFAREVDALKEQIAGAHVQTWRMVLFTAVYVPDGDVTDALPPMFVGHTAPFAGEVSMGASTYLVVLDRVAQPPGTLHVALDISFLEDHERWMQQVTIVVGVAVASFGLLLAHIATKRLVRPLARLTHEVTGLRPDRLKDHAVYSGYEDRELAEIAQAINNLLTDLDAHLKREKGLISLASHELRTPVTVISGALDVLARRDTLCDEDARVIARIRRATDEMRSDIEALLALARRGGPRHPSVSGAQVDLAESVRGVISELERATPADASRIRLLLEAPGTLVVADPSLVRMLFRNLIQNAIRHTRGGVDIGVGPGGVTVSDHGPGLPPAVLGQLAASDSAPDGGLGLFIVQLICERLGWRLDILRSDAGGTVLALQVGGMARIAHAAS
jgi:signal transduction histidine kinase